jgi:hypothetical protein
MGTYNLQKGILDVVQPVFVDIVHKSVNNDASFSGDEVRIPDRVVAEIVCQILRNKKKKEKEMYKQ